MDTSPRKIAAIFCGSDAAPGDERYEEAVALGRALAEAGWGVLNGGYGGAMEASARGACEADGYVIGVLLERFGRRANKYTNYVIVAKEIWQRIDMMADRVDAFVALPGGTGTLLEVAAVWEMMNKKFVADKPLILVGEFWRPLLETFCPAPDSKAWCGGAVRLVERADEVPGALG